jgi:hypothetical protein
MQFSLAKKKKKGWLKHSEKGLYGFKEDDKDTVFCYHWPVFNFCVQNK